MGKDLIAYWYDRSEKVQRLVTKNKQILIVALIAFLVRLLFISNPNLGTGDTATNNVATLAFLQGKDVYALPNMFESIPPFSLHLLSLWRLVGDVLGYDFQSFWKVLSSLFDTFLIILIYQLGIIVLQSRKKAFYIALLYAFNPISIVISSVHGQIEPIWLFFTLLSYFLLLQKKQMPLLSAISFGIGASVKLVPLLLLPFIILCLPGWKARITYCGVVVLTFLVLAFPELYTSFNAVNKQVLQYSSTPWFWGLSHLIYIGRFHGLVSQTVAQQLNTVLKYVMFATIALYWLIQLKRGTTDFLQSSCMVLVLFFVFTPGFGTQYILWLVPFLIFQDIQFTKIYLLLGSLAMIVTYSLGIKPVSFLVSFSDSLFNHVSLTTNAALTTEDVILFLLWGACVAYLVVVLRGILLFAHKTK